MLVKIGEKEYSLKDKLTIGDFRKLGRVPTEQDLADMDYILNMIEIAGVTDIDDINLDDVIAMMLTPKFKEWISVFVADPKKLNRA